MLFVVTFIVETSIDLRLSTSDKSFVGNDEQCLEHPQRGNTKLSTSPKKILLHEQLIISDAISDSFERVIMLFETT